MKLGACHVESPFIELGQFSTALYFSFFILIIPTISLIENTFMTLSVSSEIEKNSIKSLNLTPIFATFPVSTTMPQVSLSTDVDPVIIALSIGVAFLVILLPELKQKLEVTEDFLLDNPSPIRNRATLNPPAELKEVPEFCSTVSNRIERLLESMDKYLADSSLVAQANIYFDSGKRQQFEEIPVLLDSIVYIFNEMISNTRSSYIWDL